MVAAKEPGGTFVTQVRRSYAWLVLAGYFCLALAVPALTPVPDEDFSLPPIAPLVVADSPVPDDAMMQPLRQEANAALQALQAHTARQTASTF